MAGMMKRLRNDLTVLSLALAAAVIVTVRLYQGGSGLLPFIASAVCGAALLLRLMKVAKKKAREYREGPRPYCRGKGIEIGSCGKHTVKGSLLVDIVDNFSSAAPYKVDYRADAHELPKIESSSLDYVCASHVLEHLTNPIKAIKEWMRVLKPGGVLWLKIPDKRKTFDRKRERTKLSHLIEDFRKMVPVDDPSHIDDNNRNTDPPRNGKHPYIHNHVWVPEDMIELFNYIKINHASLKIISLRESSRKNAEDFSLVIKKSWYAPPRAP
jgi:SAM-dependent methyltransferase